MGTCSIAQGTQLGVLRCPICVRWRGMRGRSKREDRCIHTANSLHCIPETNNTVKQLYSNWKIKMKKRPLLWGRPILTPREYTILCLPNKTPSCNRAVTQSAVKKKKVNKQKLKRIVTPAFFQLQFAWNIFFYLFILSLSTCIFKTKLDVL